MIKLGVDGCSCSTCGIPLSPEEYVEICPDCGAIFCSDCVSAGIADDHICDEDGDYE